MTTSTFLPGLEDSTSQRKPPVSKPLDSQKLKATAERYSRRASQESPTSETSESEETLPGFGASESSAPAIPASQFPSPGSDEAREMTAGSGRLAATYSKTSGPLGSLVKTLLGTSVWGSTACWLTWKASATPSNRLLFQLVALEPGKGVAESGLLPTLTVSGNSNRKGASKKAADGLRTRVSLLASLMASDGDKAPKHHRRGNPSISTAVKTLWPTLLAADVKGGVYKKPQGGPSLRSLMPTLCARDYRGPHSAAHTAKGKAAGHGMSILPDYLGGPLCPRFCEWFMGYPIGHTELKASATRSSRSSRKSSSRRSRNKNDANG